MPALNFQKRFAPAVKARTKRITLRALGKRKPFSKGDTLYLFTGMRTKFCERLGQEVCQAALPAIIDEDGIIYVNSTMLSKIQRDKLAKDDGFKDYEEMAIWFEATHGLPFHGQLISW